MSTQILQFPSMRARAPKPIDGTAMDDLVDAVAKWKRQDEPGSKEARERARKETEQAAARGDRSAILALQVLHRFRERYPELAE